MERPKIKTADQGRFQTPKKNRAISKYVIARSRERVNYIGSELARSKKRVKYIGSALVRSTKTVIYI